MSNSRELTNNEIEEAIDYINNKYHISIIRYTYDKKNGRNFDTLCENIKTLKAGDNLTAIVSISSHSFSIQINKKKDGATLIIDDSYAMIAKDLSVPPSPMTALGVFAYMTNSEFVGLIKKLTENTNIKDIYANKKQYQFDGGSCHTFAIINAKYLALQCKDQTANQNYGTCESITHKQLSKEITLYSPTKKHIKYDQELDEITIASKIYEKTSKYKSV